MPEKTTSIDEAVLEQWATRLPGCRRFLENFFGTCGEYPPQVNYLNYVRDLQLYSATNRHIRENLSTLIGVFYEIAGEAPDALTARDSHSCMSVDSAVLLDDVGPRVTYSQFHKEPVTDYHRSVDAFKKELIERTLRTYGGNRTQAARALGLQRTYLLRLIRDFGVRVPVAERKR